MKNERRTLPTRRHHITQKVRIAGRRTLYISVHDDEHPAEIFLRLKGADCTSELIGLSDVIARLMSIALEHGAPLEKLGDLLSDAKFEPCGPVSGHDRLKHCSSLPDLSAAICWWSMVAERTWPIFVMRIEEVFGCEPHPEISPLIV